MLLGHYTGRVRDIIKIDVSFNGDATMDATIDVISQTKIDCSSENRHPIPRSTPSMHGRRWDAPPSGGATIGP